MSVADSTRGSADDKTVSVTLKDVAIDGKYNPALFLPSKLGTDAICQALINRGMDTVEMRRFVQRDLIDAKSSRCSDLFRDRKHMASDFKLGRLETCSYCGKKVDPSKLYLFFTLVQVEDLLFQEFMKSKDEKTRDLCAFKYLLIQSLETKVRDVRWQDGFTINGGCALFCPSRCVDCMEGPKISVVE